MSYLLMIPRRLTIVFLIASLSIMACDDGEVSEEEEEVEEVEEEAEEEVQEEEVEEVEPEVDSSFRYIPFRSDQEPLEQEGHAMAYIDRGDDDELGFRVIIAPTQIEFICGNPNMTWKGNLEEGEDTLTLIAAEGFALETGEHPIEFTNVGSTGIATDQDLRFDLTEVTDEQIVGQVTHHTEDEDEEQRVSAEFRASICERD